MPTTIAIEARPVVLFGFETPYKHLYLVKTITDNAGKVLDERVIRGDVGSDLTLVTQVDIPLASSPDARGQASPAQRYNTPLDLGGRDPDEVWSLMVQHAVNIDKAGLQYGLEAYDIDHGGEVNSNTVVASVLHTVGINLAQLLPVALVLQDAPLYYRLDAMLVDDVLLGGGTNDFIFGGIGNDSIRSGGGDDHLFGEIGADTLVGGSGNDLLDGGTGADVMEGGSGNDRYYVDFVGDRVIEVSTSSSGGVDLINASLSFSLHGKADLAGVERLALRDLVSIGVGNNLDNWIYGNANGNTLVGRLGNDVLRGKAGDDNLRGGLGRDVLEGGDGQDTFVYRSLADSRADYGIDKILDFESGDQIDISIIDANRLTAGNQAFEFIGAGSFTGAAQVRFQVIGAEYTLVQANVDADLAADFELVLRGYTKALTAGDFVL